MTDPHARASAPTRPWPLFALLALIAASTPAALWLEALVRRALLPPEFEELRAWLRPEATIAAWAFAVLAVAAAFGALALQRRLFVAALARQRRGDGPERLQHARVQTLALTTSAPQVPALLATVAFTFGAESSATVAAVGAATLGVLVQAFGLARGGALAAPASAPEGRVRDA